MENNIKRQNNHKKRNIILIILGIIIAFVVVMSYIYSPNKLIGVWQNADSGSNGGLYSDTFKGAGKGLYNGYSSFDYTYYWFGILHIKCESEGFEKTYKVSFSNDGKYMTLKDLYNKDNVILLIRKDEYMRSYREY